MERRTHHCRMSPTLRTAVPSQGSQSQRHQCCTTAQEEGSRGCGFTETESRTEDWCQTISPAGQDLVWGHEMSQGWGGAGAATQQCDQSEPEKIHCILCTFCHNLERFFPEATFLFARGTASRFAQSFHQPQRVKLIVWKPGPLRPGVCCCLWLHPLSPCHCSLPPPQPTPQRLRSQLQPRPLLWVSGHSPSTDTWQSPRLFCQQGQAEAGGIHPELWKFPLLHF